MGEEEDAPLSPPEPTPDHPRECWNCGFVIPSLEGGVPGEPDKCPKCGQYLDPNADVRWSRSIGCFYLAFFAIVLAIGLLVYANI